MGEFEALGDAVTGGIVGRAVEPRAGEVSQGHTHESTCLNCGAELVGPYCQQCGQHAHVHRTLGAFFHDFLHGVLHFEGKIWRTLPLLAWRPGLLTRRYIDGQRARYVSPIALFLFSVFLMFAVASATGTFDFASTGAIKSDLGQSIAKDRTQIKSLERQRRDAVAARRPTATIDSRLTDLRQEVTEMEKVRDKGISQPSIETSDKAPRFVQNAVKRATENPDLLIYKLKTSAYKYSWALIPISVPFVWLLFPFSRRFRMYDHIVFVTYSLCFMTLLVIAAIPIAWLLGNGASALLFVPPVHMYRQLKETYQLSRFGAAWRAFLLTVFAFAAAILFAALLVTLGLTD